MQEVAWAGNKLNKLEAKGRTYTPVPMMHHINTAIERTATVTGLPRDQIVKMMVRGQIPVYGIGGMGMMLGAGTPDEERYQ